MPSPTTPLLDVCTRANEDPIVGPGWLSPIFAGDSGLKLVSNALTGRATGGSESYWKTAFPTSQEVFVTLTTKYTGSDLGLSLFLNLQSPNSGAMAGYAAAIYKHSGSGLDLGELYRFTAAAPTVLATSGTLTIVNGDRFWLRNVAGVQTLYQLIAGVWTSVVTASDATYGAGFLGVGCDDGTLVVDDVGGGAIGSASRMLAVF
jgi:hypothetical protein